MVFDTLSKFANLKCSEISCDFVPGSQIKKRKYFDILIKHLKDKFSIHLYHSILTIFASVNYVID